MSATLSGIWTVAGTKKKKEQNFPTFSLSVDWTINRCIANCRHHGLLNWSPDSVSPGQRINQRILLTTGWSFPSSLGTRDAMWWAFNQPPLNQMPPKTSRHTNRSWQQCGQPAADGLEIQIWYLVFDHEQIFRSGLWAAACFNKHFRIWCSCSH